MKQAKLLWGEGLFLRPQHFQCQDAYHEERVSEALLTAQPLGWGIRRLEIDDDALAGGMLRIDAIDAVLPDGDSYRAPGRDRLPPALKLDAVPQEASGMVYHLTLQPVSRHGSNYEPADEPVENRRYQTTAVNAPDLYTDAADAELTVLHKAARLRPGSEPLDQYDSLPLLRIRRTAAGSYEVDTEFMPPILSVGSSPQLLLRLRRLLDALQAKANALYGFHREPSKDIIEFRSGDVASFWLLHTISSAAAALAHQLHLPMLHPERLYQELLRLAGGLLTFSKHYQLADLPSYDHADPGRAFVAIDRMLRDLLDTVISTQHFAIQLTETKPAFHLGRLDSDKITDRTAFYLGVSSAQPINKTIENVPLRLKIGAPDDVDKLVLSAMHGVKISHAPQVPPAIPVKPGACYFSLDREGALYERMLKARSISIYTPTGFPDLSLDLIAVNA